jgi:hypothetical protein
MCKEGAVAYFEILRDICLDGQRKTTNIVRQDRRCPLRNSNHTPYEYKCGTWANCSVSKSWTLSTHTLNGFPLSLTGMLLAFRLILC